MKSSDILSMDSRLKAKDDHVRECMADLNTPLADAIDKAMTYILDEATNNTALHRLTTLMARGAVLRALREERERMAAEALATPPTHPISQNAFIREVIKFNMIAGRTMDQFDPRATALHTAFQLEELGEKLELGLLKPNPFQLNSELLHLMNTITAMKYLGLLLKSGALDPLFAEGDPVELLDGDIDVMVVSIGSMMSQGADIFGAVHAVSGANLAKFPGGVCIKDKDGKIQKPDGWTPADLTPYLHASKRDGGVWIEYRKKEPVPATVTGADGVARPNPAAGAPNVPDYDPKG